MSSNGGFKVYRNICGEYHIHVYQIDGCKDYVWEVAGPTDDWDAPSGTAKTVTSGLKMAESALKKAMKLKVVS